MKYFEMPGGDPAFHQAFEQVVFEQIRDDAVLLLWINAPAVVCGAYQNLFQEASVLRAAQRGIAVLRRDSGGGTVYHDPGNLNYTIITESTGYVEYDGPLGQILTALHRIGVPAVQSGVCDLTLEGKKISGSAQRVSRGRTLHHGTLLYAADLEQLQMVADRRGRQYISRAVTSRPAEVRNIEPWFSGGIAAFRDALRDAFPADLTPAVLSEAQLAAARRLAKEKYQGWDWTCGRSPDFTCAVAGTFAGEPLSLCYAAHRGVITACELGSPALEPGAGRRLLQAKLCPENILALCRELTDAPAALADLIL